MSKITFNDLPKELIINILRRVYKNKLKNAILTCKLWKEIIESTCSWSVELWCNQHERITYMLNTNRKFHMIRIYHLFNPNNIIKILTRIGSSVAKLVIIQSSFDNLVRFVEMLQLMPNLQHVIMFQVTMQRNVKDDLSRENLPVLPKLKVLEVVESECAIMKCFARSKIETLKIQTSKYVKLSSTSVRDFLQTQQQLKILAFRAIDNKRNELLRSEITEIQFRLTHLSLLDIRLRDTNDYNNLWKLIKSQATTMKELQIGHTFPDFVYSYVFAEFKNLKTLHLMMTEMPTESTFYKHLEVNRSIEKLIITNFFLNIDGGSHNLKEIFNHLPNVKNLTLHPKCNEETLLLIANKLTQLESLTVDNFQESVCISGVKFPKLRSLTMWRLKDKINWVGLTKNNPLITQLTIGFVKNVAFLNNEDIQVIFKNLKLQKVRIGHGMSIDTTTLDMIRKNCPTLKELDLHIAGLLRINALRFHPDNNWSLFYSGLKFWNNADYNFKVNIELDLDHYLPSD